MISKNHIKLTLNKKDYLVSTISSLLRTLQASIRESDEISNKNSSTTKLNLKIEIENECCVFLFRFICESEIYNSQKELEIYSKQNFSRFIEKLLKEIKSNSQQTLWGNSPKPITKNTHRVTRFLSDFSRLGSATIQFEKKEIKLDNKNIIISSN